MVVENRDLTEVVTLKLFKGVEGIYYESHLPTSDSNILGQSCHILRQPIKEL